MTEEATSHELRPRARRDGVLRRTLGDETVVYDLETHEAHCLNPAAAWVWQHADATRTVAQLTARLASDLGLPEDEDLVWLSLVELEEAGLMDDSPMTAPAATTRRELLGRLARTSALALAAPAVSTVVVPTASAAATCLDAGEMCVSGVECCSGICFGGICAG